MSREDSEVKKFYDELSPYYRDIRFASRYYQKVSEKEQNFVLRNSASTGRILEIGPGTGRFTAKLVVRDVRVTAVDISPRMLEVIRHEIPAKNLELVCGDFASLSRLDGYGSFDTVVCMRVLPHVTNVSLALSHMYGALRTGGNAIFDLWNDRSFIIAARRLLGRKSKVYTAYYHYAKMRQLINKEGFEISDILPWGYPRIKHWSLDSLGSRFAPAYAYSIIFNAVKLKCDPVSGQ